jgi:hypothetical protein
VTTAAIPIIMTSVVRPERSSALHYAPKRDFDSLPYI